MGTITKTVQLLMERFRQKQMSMDGLTQPGWRDAADCFHERQMQYWMAELKVPAVVKPQTDNVAAPPSLTTFAEIMETLDNFPRISLMQQGTSRPGCRHMRPGPGKPQSP